MSTFRRLSLAVLAAACLLAMTCAPASAEIASFYSRPQPTASGEWFNPRAMTAAHRTLSFGTRLRVCRNGCVVVRVTDRGPYIRGRSIDLSAAAARAIGITHKVGVARVSIQRVH